MPIKIKGSPGNKDELSGPQSIAARTLAKGGLKKEAAANAGVHPQAVSEWMKKPSFCSAVREMRAEIDSELKARIRSSAETAFKVLDEVMAKGTMDQRLRAASFFIDRFMKLAVKDDEAFDPSFQVDADQLAKLLTPHAECTGA